VFSKKMLSLSGKVQEASKIILTRSVEFLTYNGSLQPDTAK